MTKLAFFVISAVLATATAQDNPAQNDEKPRKASIAVPASQIPQRRELMRNKKVIVSTTELQPGKAVPMHRHERDYVTIVLTDGVLRETEESQSAMRSGERKMERMFGAMHVPGASGDKVRAGEVVYHEAGYTHANDNRGESVMQAVTVEFLEPAGKQRDPEAKPNRYCSADEPPLENAQSQGGTMDLGAGGKRALRCVEEKYLFCTEKFCVEDVTIDPGALTTKHSHATDHLLVAVTDYQLTDISQKGKTVRSRKAGGFEYIPAGITHQLTNSGKKQARFVVIAFK
jgi:quercetin dioxygenase-like cupin family protein